MKDDHRLTPLDLSRSFDRELEGFDSTGGLIPIEGIVGQDRAISALRIGLGVDEASYNIFVAGEPGIGKMTAVKEFLEALAREKAPPGDWVYVNDFKDPYRPTAIPLPAGRGRQLQDDMKVLIEQIRQSILQAFESEDYHKKHDSIVRELSRHREAALEGLMRQATEAGFTIRPTTFGFVILPTRDGHPMEEDDFASLSQSEREALRQQREHLEGELSTTLSQLRGPQRSAEDKIHQLDQQVARFIVGEHLDELREKYHHLPAVVEYLTEVHQDILQDVESPRSVVLPDEDGDNSPLPWPQDLASRKYLVNLLVDGSQRTIAPVVVETNLSYNSIFGRVERESYFGSLYTDFTMIRAGSIHQANGGYLVIPAEGLLQSPFCWDTLKRILKSGQIEIEEPAERLGFLASKTLRPQPIPLNLKVILVGRPLFHYLLQTYDLDFPELFKVKADFDTSMPASSENIDGFLRVLASLSHRDGLNPLDRSAAARLLIHAARMAEDKAKLSTHFGALADILREAHYWSLQEGVTFISACHVQQALDQKVYRSNLIRDHIQEMIARGALLVDTKGSVTGQVNGISVMDLGDTQFGRPSRITATVGPGGQGLVDIEREVELGGAVHSKGVLIVVGYLAQKYAKDMLLTLAGRLVFEQSYQGVEGDSASSAELFAILSALSRLPIQQGIAVTGSVNQHGEVQPIGAVNQKIEGFFEVCQTRGLTGEQGVIIPSRNVQNLLLSQEVIDAVHAGDFHIWAIDTIDQGLEILMGVAAGEEDQRGEFPEGTVNALAKQRICHFAQYLREFPEAVGSTTHLGVD